MSGRAVGVQLHARCSCDGQAQRRTALAVAMRVSDRGSGRSGAIGDARDMAIPDQPSVTVTSQLLTERAPAARIREIARDKTVLAQIQKRSISVDTSVEISRSAYPDSQRSSRTDQMTANGDRDRTDDFELLGVDRAHELKSSRAPRSVSRAHMIASNETQELSEYLQSTNFPFLDRYRIPAVRICVRQKSRAISPAARIREIARDKTVRADPRVVSSRRHERR